MKVLILGSSGVIGQHMRLWVPPGVTPVWHRKMTDPLHVGCDLTEKDVLWRLLETVAPDAIVNLAGENNTDAVERDPGPAYVMNVNLVRELAEYCLFEECRLIQVSTQAVFGGDRPPYGPGSPTAPVNEYGRQKLLAEGYAQRATHWTIIRPTFVMGVRPMPLVGRVNPAEQMLDGQARQVCDRFFSPSFARDVAVLIWDTVMRPRDGHILHLGNPVSVSRHNLAGFLGVRTEPVSHNDFPGLAPRPVDTCYSEESLYLSSVEQGLAQCQRDWQARRTLDLTERAREIALFLGLSESVAHQRLNLGFAALHAGVAADFRHFNPQNDDQLLKWYRETESYLWELSAYHCHDGFNYSGCCRGIAERLKEAQASRVLVLGDGIGDLTLELKQAGLDPTYHDLEGSRTAAFAAFRFWLHSKEPVRMHCTTGWNPDSLANSPYDAVISLDFMEHVTSVLHWMGLVRQALKPTGLFCAVNAFACGSGPEGTIPCHLKRNDRYETEWDPMLAELGFSQESSNWYRKAA